MPQWNVYRRFPRYPVDIPVTVRARTSSVEITRGRMIDLGLGGLGAELDGELNPSEKVILVFALGERTKKLEISSIVRHRTLHRHGFEFLGDDPEDREIIRHYCSNLVPIRE